MMVTAVAFFAQIAAVTPAVQAAEVTGAPRLLGAIAGKVTDEEGNAIAGASAEAFTCSDFTPSGSALTGKDGEFLLKGLGEGCYRVRFSAEKFESTWHGKSGIKDDCAQVKVSGDKVQGIDGELAEAGSVISGTVKSAEGPLSGVWVTVLRTGASIEDVSISDGYTDQKGAFSVRIHPGNCVVAFVRKGYVTQIHGKSPLEPTMVEAAKGKTVRGINATLVPGGSITGSVSDDGGKPLAGIQVVANSVSRTAYPVAALSDQSGKFVLDGLASGKYRVAFADPERRFLLQWHDGKTTPEEAAVMTVTAPAAVTGIKAVLRQSGGIAGMVTNQAGKAVPQVTVIAEPVERNTRGGSAITDETGSYHIPGLDSGSFVVSFRDAGAHLPRYYQDAAERETAQRIEVRAPQVVFGVNQVLEEGIMLTGKVVNASGEPIPEIMVAVHPAKEQLAQPVYGFSESDGSFSVAVDEGEYLVEFRGSEGYLPQWYGNRSSRSEAVPVTASKKEGAQSLEVVLHRGASIAGSVKNRAGAGIKGVTVTARDAATGDWDEAATSEEGGKYLIEGLKSGSYLLVADGSDAGYIEAKLAQPVTVTAPAALEQVDLVLVAGGAVSGKVTDPEGNPLPEVVVEAYDPATWDEVGTGYTDAGGEYKIGGLPEGSYQIRFEKRRSKYQIQWYKGKSRREESAQVTVTGTATVTGVDARLTPGIPLTGTVTGADGAPLPGAKVEIYGGLEDEPFAEAQTDLRGTYTVSSLAPGSYRIRFSHGDHVSRWYGGSDRRTASAVTVKETGVSQASIALTPAAGKLHGKLMNPQGKKIGQAWLTAIDAATGIAVADERICECSGEFHTAVPSGVYQLRVERHGQVTWYGGDSKDEALTLPGSGEISGLEMVLDDEGVKGKKGSR